jgi:alpha-aminoadipate carrier protein LysW
MNLTCDDCGAFIMLPEDLMENEIIGCHDCGLDYVVTKNNIGEVSLTELLIEGEDWGE